MCCRRMDRMMASMMTNMNDMLGRDPFGPAFPMLAFNPAMDPMSRLMPSPAMFPTSSMSFSHHMSPQYSSYSTSSSVISMTTDMSGRPQIYESSHSSHAGPGGVRETTSSVRDSRSGLQKMSIGRHIEDRAHVMERTRNQYTGDEEHNNEYINIEVSYRLYVRRCVHCFAILMSLCQTFSYGCQGGGGAAVQHRVQ
jgi:hypothetical protein